jgi:FtsH-binding integral membrane protein
MSLEAVFLLLGFALLGAILLSAVCSVVYPEAQRSAREWVNTAISIVTLVVLAWTARSIVDQVTEMRKALKVDLMLSAELTQAVGVE